MLDDEATVRGKFVALRPVMDERLTRLWAGAEADALGEGGIAIVERATGLSRTTIRAGRDELRGGVTADDVVGVRRSGGGRARIEETTPGIVEALETLVDPVTRGDPESPLRWTSKSTRKLAAELTTQGFAVSAQKVGQLLAASGYSLQATQKTLEGSSHPDRNEQFEFINDRVDAFHGRGAPVISVDTKKKELVGAFRNQGREWQPRGEPVPVRVHDFIDDVLGKVIPYGVYDLARNTGWVSIGTDHDTPALTGVRATALPEGPSPSTTLQRVWPAAVARSHLEASRQFFSGIWSLTTGRLFVLSPHGQRTWLFHEPKFLPVTRPGIMPFHFPPARLVL